MPGINMMPSGSTLQIPLEACTAFSASGGNAKVELTWTDPKDKYATPEGETAQDPDQLVSVWDHTVLVRKTGSQPAGPNDGTVVVSSSVRDQYASAGYVDTGLQNDTTYYYGVFAYNTDGVASEGAFVTATPIAGTPLSQLAEGTLIKILENGSPVEFYLAKHNYEPDLNGQGRELLVRKDVYDRGIWEKNASSYDTYDFRSSDILQWLNNTYKFLFSSQVQEFIGVTNYYYAQDASSYNVVPGTSSIFLLSYCELIGYPSGSSIKAEGEPLAIRNTISRSQYNGGASEYFTRSREFLAHGYEGIAGISGVGNYQRLSPDKSYGRRPCFTIPNTALVDQDLNLIET